MRMMLTSSPVLEVSARHIQTSPMDDVIPTETVEVSTLAEVTAAIEAYAAKIRTTGRAAVISAMQHPRDGSRKIRGFDKAAGGMHRVNCPTPVGGETITCEHPEN